MLISMKPRIAIILLLGAMVGCSDDPVRTRQEGSPWHVSGIPLAVGNTWHYDIAFDISWTRENGTDLRPPEHLALAGTRHVVSIDTIDGRMYAVEEFVADAEGGSRIVRWRRLRQDASAVYQADVPSSVPPGEVPGDEEIGEQIRLRFPLEAGASWQLRPGSDAIVLTVEALDTLSLATGDTPAWRIRVDVFTAGPDDYSRVWYGPEGMLRREDHTELNALDVLTGERVHIVTHEVEALVSFDVTRTARAYTNTRPHP